MKRIALVAAEMNEHNLRLQPWRYLTETARQLVAQGYQVTVLTNAPQPASLDRLEWIQLPEIRSPRWKANLQLSAALEKIRPVAVLWHIGLTNTLYETLPAPNGAATIGIFTSPIYTPAEIGQLGLPKVMRNREFLSIHLAGSLTPRIWLRRRLKQNHLAAIVTETETTRNRLTQNKMWNGPIHVIRPGVDPIWKAHGGLNSSCALPDFSEDDFVVTFFGAPAELRGLPSLIQAAAKARQTVPALKLLLLIRRQPGEFETEMGEIQNLLETSGLSAHTHTVDQNLTPTDLVDCIRASDLVALPFELVASDAPLSLLETHAIGKALLTTTTACLAELSSSGRRYIAPPGDISAMAAELVRAARDWYTNEKSLDFPPLPARSWAETGADWQRLLNNL